MPVWQAAQDAVMSRNPPDAGHVDRTVGQPVSDSEMIARLRARVLELEAQCEAGAASEQRWIDWLVATGLLHYHNACHRPDGSHGPAWVLRTPRVINGDACVAWQAESAAGALREFLKAPNVLLTGDQQREQT